MINNYNDDLFDRKSIEKSFGKEEEGEEEGRGLSLLSLYWKLENSTIYLS